MSIKLVSESKLNEIRGKMLVGHATPTELKEFLKYVTSLEILVEEASNEDFYGTEGWQHRLNFE